MKLLSRRQVRAFTLIEVMVVIAILGVLAAMLVPRLLGRPDEARAAAARQDNACPVASSSVIACSRTASGEGVSSR
jgi:prepilin-type N-terminal cleavage/methylation domain-containing protein